MFILLCFGGGGKYKWRKKSFKKQQRVKKELQDFKIIEENKHISDTFLKNILQILNSIKEINAPNIASFVRVGFAI